MTPPGWDTVKEALERNHELDASRCRTCTALDALARLRVEDETLRARVVVLERERDGWRDEAEARGELRVRERERADALERERDEAEKAAREAAARWRESAANARADGYTSEICGETGIPSHVLASVRAQIWEAAASALARVREGEQE